MQGQSLSFASCAQNGKRFGKDELRAYLEHGREKYQVTIDALTEGKARQHCAFAWGEVAFLELLLYNMHHVQEHAAQLSLFLGQKGVPIPEYVTKTNTSIRVEAA